MLWLITCITFIATLSLVVAVFYAFSPSEVNGRLLSQASTHSVSRTQLLMIRAGYRSPEAILAMRGFKLMFPIGTLAAVFLTGAYRLNPFMIPVFALAVGYLVPNILLTWRVHARQHHLRRGLLDALDLLVICVEAGLGLDQALMKVAQDMRITHHELSEELQLVNLEMRIGKTRIRSYRRNALEPASRNPFEFSRTRCGPSVVSALRK